MESKGKFSPSFGNMPEKLVGREEIIEELTNGLDSMKGSRERATLILGQRGQGKTVLLLEIAKRAEEKEYIVAQPTIVSDNMLERIVEKLQDEGEKYIGEKKSKLSGINLGARGFSAGLQFTREVQETKSFSYKLSKLVEVIGKAGKGVLILIDEVQANSAGLKELIIAYQELVGEGQNIAMVIAGLPGAISTTLNNHVLTFLNRARKIELGPLPLTDIDAFYKQSFEEIGIIISDDQLEKATKSTEGSPYMMQLIGYNIVLYADDNGNIDDSTFKRALDKAKESYINDICGTTVNALSAKDEAFLKAMLPGDKATKMTDIAKELGVSADYAQQYKKRLIDAGVIEQVRRGEVAYSLPLLAEYLEKH